MEWTSFLLFICMIVTILIQECFTKECDMNAISACAMMMSRLASSTGEISQSCKASADIKSCLAPYEEACNANKDSNGYKLYSQSLAAIAGFTSACKCYPAWQCALGMQVSSESSVTDMTEICRNYTQAKMCMMPYEDLCKDDMTTQNIKSSFKNIEGMCSKDKCDMGLLKCNKKYERLGGMKGIFRPWILCKDKDLYRNCAEPIRKTCAGHMEKSYMMSVRQSDMIYEILDLICVREHKALMSSVQCFNQSDVVMKTDSCGKLSTPMTDENGQFITETEKAQCLRMSNMSNCLSMSVQKQCNEKATETAVRIGKSFLRIMYDADNLNCVVDGRGGSDTIQGVKCVVALLLLLSFTALW